VKSPRVSPCTVNSISRASDSPRGMNFTAGNPYPQGSQAPSSSREN
jgi:hypothetical protein